MATQLKEPDEQIEAIEGADEPQARDFEAEARVRGWRPEGEYTGKAEWVDAETFLAKAQTDPGLAKAENAQLRKRISIMEGMLKKVMKSEQRSYANALADLKRQQEAAVETGDVAAFRALDADAEQIRKDMAEDTPAQDRKQEAIEAFDTFREDNAWYDRANLASASEQDQNARLYADRMMDRHVEKTATLNPVEFFDYIKGLVDEKYPNVNTKTPRTKPASDVAGVQRGGARGSAHSYANLDADAKRQCDRFIDSGVYKGKTKEEARARYAKDYFEGQG